MDMPFRVAWTTQNTAHCRHANTLPSALCVFANVVALEAAERAQIEQRQEDGSFRTINVYRPEGVPE